MMYVGDLAHHLGQMIECRTPRHNSRPLTSRGGTVTVKGLNCLVSRREVRTSSMKDIAAVK